MYLPFVSKGLTTYPGLPGTALAVGNVGSVGEEGEELGFLVVAAVADLLRGSKRTETGFGYRELYAPLMASTVTPIGPPRRTLRVLLVSPVADTLLSTFTVWEAYPALLTVTVNLSRRPFTNVAGVTPFSPEDSTTFALDGSLNTVSLS